MASPESRIRAPLSHRQWKEDKRESAMVSLPVTWMPVRMMM